MVQMVQMVPPFRQNLKKILPKSHDQTHLCSESQGHRAHALAEQPPECCWPAPKVVSAKRRYSVNPTPTLQHLTKHTPKHPLTKLQIWRNQGTKMAKHGSWWWRERRCKGMPTNTTRGASLQTSWGCLEIISSVSKCRFRPLSRVVSLPNGLNWLMKRGY